MRGSPFVSSYRTFRSYWFYTLINSLALAIGYFALIVVALYAGGELSFDRFIGGAASIQLISPRFGGAPDTPISRSDRSPAGLAQWIRTDVPDVAAVARLVPVEWSVGSQRLETREHFYWADPNIFTLLNVPAVSGDLTSALNRPGTAVLTQATARKYFGRENVVGQSLILNRSIPVTITAVLRDFPSNTSLDREIFVSGLADYAMLDIFARHPEYGWPSCYTYVRLKPGAMGSNVSARLLQLTSRRWKGPDNRPSGYDLVPLTRLHFSAQSTEPMKPRGHPDVILGLVFVALTTLIVALCNFAVLLSVQTEGRADEIHVRRALGATPNDLVRQSLLDAFLISAAAMLIALAATERVLPIIDRDLGLSLDLWAFPWLLPLYVAVTVLGALAAGLYAALGLGRTPSTLVRHGLVVTQFTLLIIMLIGVDTVHRQWVFSTGNIGGIQADRIVLIDLGPHIGCYDAFRADVEALPGVRRAVCSRDVPRDQNTRPAWIGGAPQAKAVIRSVEPAFFGLYNVPVIAGGLSGFNRKSTTYRPVVISRAAVAALGYRNPPAAIGAHIFYKEGSVPYQAVVIGVVGDLQTLSVRNAAVPVIFDTDSTAFDLLSVELATTNLQSPLQNLATLQSLDHLWARERHEDRPIERHFLTEYLGRQYKDLNQQRIISIAFALGGLALAVLGVIGISSFLTQARHREMTIRKALGASPWDVCRFMIRPFVWPLALANLVGWPLGYLLVEGWLAAYSLHVDQTPLAYLSAAGLTALTVLLPVGVHAAFVARDGPPPTRRDRQ